jgi:hypothetical protein
MQTNQQLELIAQQLLLEHPLEHSIVSDAQWIQGAFWGQPRPGHPEGMVLYHIQEVLENVHRCTQDPLLRHRLRLIALCHDTFKYQEEKQRPRQDWSKHHAVLARQFLERYTNDEAVLRVTELHDEAYHVWQEWQMSRYFDAGRWQRFLTSLGQEHLQLFYLFFKCDTLTGDKILAPLHWFEAKVQGIQLIQW